MTVLVDTGILYADHDTDATRHETARRALDAVYDGQLGQPYISDYVFDEAITLTRTRTGSYEAAEALNYRLRGQDAYPHVYDMLDVSGPVFADAIRVFERYHDHALSFTDATNVALVDRHDLEGILSFDDDFDGIVHRFDPSDV